MLIKHILIKYMLKIKLIKCSTIDYMNWYPSLKFFRFNFAPIKVDKDYYIITVLKTILFYYSINFNKIN